MAFDGGPLRKAMALSWHCVYTLPKKEIMLTQATKLNTRPCDWFLLLSHMFSIYLPSLNLYMYVFAILIARLKILYSTR